MKRVKSASVRGRVCISLMGLLVCCPASFGQDPLTIDSEYSDNNLFVLPTETVDLVTGGRIKGDLYVYGGVVNIYGGAVEGHVIVQQNANVTVFGRVFTVSSGSHAGTYADTGTYEGHLCRHRYI